MRRACRDANRPCNCARTQSCGSDRSSNYPTGSCWLVGLSGDVFQLSDTSPGSFSSLEVLVFSSIFHLEDRSEDRDRPSTRRWGGTLFLKISFFGSSEGFLRLPGFEARTTHSLRFSKPEERITSHFSAGGTKHIFFFPDMACMRRVYRDRMASIGQQPGTKSAYRPAGKPKVLLLHRFP